MESKTMRKGNVTKCHGMSYNVTSKMGNDSATCGYITTPPAEIAETPPFLHKKVTKGDKKIDLGD
jgi:hypothetical protein